MNKAAKQSEENQPADKRTEVASISYDNDKTKY